MVLGLEAGPTAQSVGTAPVIRFLLPRVALAAFLVVPFTLKLAGSRWEPYPAVLMPVGAALFDLRQPELTFTQTEIQALDADGREHAIDMARLLRPLRAHQWGDILVNHFGLGTKKTFRARLGTWTVVSTRGVQSPANEAHTREWLRRRIAEQGVRDAVTLRVRRFTLSVDTHQRSRSTRQLASSYDVDLAG